MENDGEDGDDSYANAYLNDDDVDESEDAELAEMLAKVQSIQQVEGRLQPTETLTSSTGVYKSQDGITTISRSALSARTAGASVLTGVKKSAIYEEKLLKAATATKTIEKLRHKVVATSPSKDHVLPCRANQVY
ncbi:hypothetical protein AM588_10005235 [Phytophthora nicotianae]|uniref:Uncharacterized protein n=1 Tax=Phytophthora nicotianae TaxID=4792 RepID=A0A0W8CUW0_PHYNI|nr:hypothetical protein AM588_10005235 [Phytophthora nicotianae]